MSGRYKWRIRCATDIFKLQQKAGGVLSFSKKAFVCEFERLKNPQQDMSI